DGDLRRIDAELLGHRLRNNRLGTIAPEGREHRHDELAGGPQAQTHALRDGGEPRRVVPEPEFSGPVDAALLGGGEANAEIASLLSRLRLHAAKPGVARRLERLVKDRGVIAAIINVSAWGLEGKTVGSDEVPATDLDGVDPERLGGGVHEALQAEVG